MKRDFVRPPPLKCIKKVESDRQEFTKVNVGPAPPTFNDKINIVKELNYHMKRFAVEKEPLALDRVKELVRYYPRALNGVHFIDALPIEVWLCALECDGGLICDLDRRRNGFLLTRILELRPDLVDVYASAAL